MLLKAKVFSIDNAQKIISDPIIQTCNDRKGTWRIKDEPAKSISGVPAKDPLKIQLVTQWFPITPKVWEIRNSMCLGEEETCCLYSVIELTKLSWM